ncbi:MAG: hypothetical protein JWR61_844 [Ferruginibacter sp.]|uniref:6-bladed beta-propeller n=1 Tax=Ferruginibacter sp. TaxID=1940288 RepID=UPI0026585974|nr:6-bladed beta-propeller [Ferruginibacter sp.]MDB5275889.1 hypothetical protein [Ferruginibacter sp.]
MKFLQPFFFIGCFVLLASCSNTTSKSHQIISIDNSKILDVKNVSNYIASIKIIPLIEDDKNHFASVFKVLISHNKYLIYDRLNSNKILLFNADGSFNKLVCKVGDNVNYPLNMTDMWLTKDGDLEVYDYAQMEVIKFDSLFVRTSSFKSKKLNHFISLMNTGNGYVGYANFSDYNSPFHDKFYSIAFLDDKLEINKVDQFFDKKLQGVLWPIYGQHFSKLGDSIRFIKSYDNIVYNIVDNMLFERYEIKYRYNNPPKDIFKIVKDSLELFKDRHISPNIRAELFKNYAMLQGAWNETPQYILIRSKDTSGLYGNPFVTLYNKGVNQEMFSARKLVDTINYNMQLPNFIYYDNQSNEFISVVPGIELKKLLYPNSVFKNIISDSPYQFYVVKAKFII